MVLRLVQQGHNDPSIRQRICWPLLGRLNYCSPKRRKIVCAFSIAPPNCADEWQGQFDLVLYHAVLEWLAEPLAAIAAFTVLSESRLPSH